MVFPFHSAPEKGVIYQKQILLGTRGLRQRHDLTADVAQSKAATAFLQDVTQSKSLQCSFPKRCRAKLATADVLWFASGFFIKVVHTVCGVCSLVQVSAPRFWSWARYLASL